MALYVFNSHPVISMSTLACRFCAHDNPAGAKFCNDCGSPLHLKPCPHCEAFTDLSAENCHQCGASFGGVAADVPESAPANPVVVETAAGDAIRPHIPESLAACLDAADNRTHPADDEVRHYIGTTVSGDSASNGSGSGANRVRARDRVVSSRRSAYRALLVIVPVVLGAVAYYAYLQGAPVMRSLANLIVVAKSADEASRPVVTTPAEKEVDRGERAALVAPAERKVDVGALPDAAAPAEKDVDVGAPATVVAPARKDVDGGARPIAGTPKRAGASAAPTDSAPAAAPVDHAAESAVQAAPTSARVSVDESVTSKTRLVAPAKSGRARKPADAAAIATHRLVTRDRQGAVPPPDVRSPAGTDKDAIETRRLITRELGKFLPPNANERTGKPAPATDSRKEAMERR